MRRKNHPKFWLYWMLAGTSLLLSPPLRAQYPWPVTPFDQSQEITGTFCEYRDTGSSPHFHNGVDIPKPDGSPVYAVMDGRVTSMSATGSNAYVRVENFAYVHIAPAPGLSIGDSVFAQQTLLGTILPGMGHVHFVDGYVSSERQPLRQNGGLTPYEDPWPPQISNLRFFLGPTGQPFPNNQLSGPVDITFRVREANGPPTTRESRLNNGAYIVGYQILSPDRQQVVFSPSANGVQFKFDTKPSNSFVHNVFDPAQSSTSSHVYRVTDKVTRRIFWDTGQLPEGRYTVMVFAGDTRDNFDTLYVDVTVSRRDLLPPAQPVLLATLMDAGPEFSWKAGNEPDLFGFRLYSSPDNAAWSLFRDETALTGGITHFAPVLALPAPTYFYLTAVDSAQPPNESQHSDVYGMAPDSHAKKLLIVDGFDRTQSSGSWHQPWHWFAYTHGEAIAANGFGFSTCANDAVISGDIDLLDYDAVFWLLGDESTADETFSSIEQARVKAYLQKGGRLFVSGSEIAWDLGAKGSSTDRAFLRDFLKIQYQGDDSNNYTVKGVSSGLFSGLQLTYGSQPYPEDWPDYFIPVAGGVTALKYSNGLIAGVEYAGTFAGGNAPGKVVVVGFPFETISGESMRHAFMQRVLQFFFPQITAVTQEAGNQSLPTTMVLHPNYPNPFAASASRHGPGLHPGTTITLSLPQTARISAAVYDLLGRRVKSWPSRVMTQGVHRIHWSGRNERGIPVSPGIYFLRVKGIPLAHPNQAWVRQQKMLVR